MKITAKLLGILVLAGLEGKGNAVFQVFFLLLVFQVILVEVVGIDHLAEFAHANLAKAFVFCEKNVIHAVGYGIKIMGNH